ncbi:hypothetical protein T310_0140, partial [Rasamsonia emersonii CBS 393.64]
SVQNATDCFFFILFDAFLLGFLWTTRRFACMFCLDTIASTAFWGMVLGQIAFVGNHKKGRGFYTCIYIYFIVYIISYPFWLYVILILSVAHRLIS